VDDDEDGDLELWLAHVTAKSAEYWADLAPYALPSAVSTPQKDSERFMRTSLTLDGDNGYDHDESSGDEVSTCFSSLPHYLPPCLFPSPNLPYTNT